MTEKQKCPNSVTAGPGLAKFFGRNCTNNAEQEIHSCPYQEEIWDNNEPVCFCCKDCIHECGMDI
jgi:hypothetical protein